MGTNLPAGFFTNKPGPLAGAGLAAMEQDRIAKLELPGALPPESLVILDGSISPTRAAVIVDTEGGAPADDLNVISTTLSDGTMLHEGMELTIRAKDASRVITVKNSSAVNGVLTADGKDVVLGTDWWLTLRQESGFWRQKLLAQPQKVTSKDHLGVMQVGQHLEVTPEGIVDVPVASESMQGIGRSATTAEVESGITGENGPAWVTPERLKERLDAEINRHKPGDIAFKAQRYNELPSGWYFMNGTRYAVGTPQEKVLRNLSVNFKEDWGITTTDEGTNVPNWFHSDGRGPTMRAVNGAARQVGSIEEDAIQKITGSMSIESNAGTIRGGTGGSTDSSVSGAFTKGSARNGGKTGTQSGMGFDLVLDSSLSARSADETRMLNRGMTPAIFLGV